MHRHPASDSQRRLVVSSFDASALDSMTPQMAQRRDVSIGDWRVGVAEAASCGPAWVARYDGVVAGVGGIALRWRGRASLWCVLPDGVAKTAWVGIHRAVAGILPQAAALGVWRLEAEARADFAPGRRWLTMLGFAEEGLMWQYGPEGEDYMRYARLLERGAWSR